MRSEDLIVALGRDVPPVRRLPPPHRRLLGWLAVVIPVLVVIALAAGPRPDLADALAQPRFILTIAAALATGLTAAWAALTSSVPGLGGWRLALPALPAAVWLAVIGEGCWREWLVFGPASLLPALRVQCLPEIAMVGIVPMAAMVLVLRRAAALRPAVTGTLAALAAAATASAALEFFHHSEAAMVALVWHVGGVALLSGMAGLAGRRLFPLAQARCAG